MVSYAILGGGRLARHFSEYFRLLDIPHTGWARDAASPCNSCDTPDARARLKMAVGDAERVLLLVSDGAIASLLKQYPFLHDRPLIHCSGALSFPGVAGAHPLMTYADELYDLDRYRSVTFMVESGHNFQDLFPGLPNPHCAIRITDKARYHALCVMAGNYAQLLWQGVSDDMAEQLHLPAETLHAYLRQVTDNFVRAPQTALTGPLVRGDKQTVARNLLALDGDPLQALYRAFVDYYQATGVAPPGAETARPASSGMELAR